jgi:hypothetical protein
MMFRWFVGDVALIPPAPPASMFSERSTVVREKKFRPPGAEVSRRGLLSSATLTDDHTLFLLNQQRERRSTIGKGSWFSRLFGRR